MRSSIPCIAALLVSLGCAATATRSAIVLAPLPPRPGSLQWTAYWPYLADNGDITLPWCEYACRRFVAKDATLLGCRQVSLSFSLQQSLGEVSGVACEVN